MSKSIRRCPHCQKETGPWKWFHLEKYHWMGEVDKSKDDLPGQSSMHVPPSSVFIKTNWSMMGIPSRTCLPYSNLLLKTFDVQFELQRLNIKRCLWVVCGLFAVVPTLWCYERIVLFRMYKIAKPNLVIDEEASHLFHIIFFSIILLSVVGIYLKSAINSDSGGIRVRMIFQVYLITVSLIRHNDFCVSAALKFFWPDATYPQNITAG